jgi:peptide chain release factor 2
MVMDNFQKEIEELEMLMAAGDFWSDKENAQRVIKEIKILKDKRDGVGVYDAGSAVITIYSGAGGDDSEDFSRMLLEMYYKYSERKGYSVYLIHKNENSQGGYRNVSVQVDGKGVYGTLKNESGVHRLVRISPFNSKSLRHTSFSMVEVIPVIPAGEVTIRPEDLRIEFSKSSGPGGQNVNKRETAVRIVHIPTNIAVHVETERSQEHNKQKALEMIAAKLYTIEQKRAKAELEGRQISKTTEIEWGSQIRSYVLHPYKLVKDHRTEVETSDTSGVLEDGDLDEFIEAERAL